MLPPVRKSRDAIAASLREALERRPEVLEAYLFGSLARAEARPHSDVDVAVTLDRAASDPSGLGFDAILGAELMAALGSDRVDVVILNSREARRARGEFGR
jgi:predicted nucleotidyltransferase